MSITQTVIAVSLPAVCIAAADGLMRLFDVKDATSEQGQAEAERLLAQFPTETNVGQRVRTAAPRNAALVKLPSDRNLVNACFLGGWSQN